MMLVPVMAFAIVVLRGWYQGRKRWPARLIEGVIFGMVATVLHPVARYVFESRIGFPGDVANNAAITFVCALGYIGADTLSDAAKRILGGVMATREEAIHVLALFPMAFRLSNRARSLE